MNPPAIYLLRHGQTRGNLEKRFQGWRTDTELTDTGREQAELCGRALRVLLGRRGEYEEPAYVTSPVGRARKSMEIVRSELGLPPTGYDVDERVREYDFGQWSGMRRAQVRADFPQDWREREADRWRVPVPGGESYEQLVARAADWLADCRRETVLVSHSAFGRALRGVYAGLRASEIIDLSVEEPHTTVIRLREGRIEHFSATALATEAGAPQGNPGAATPRWHM